MSRFACQCGQTVDLAPDRGGVAVCPTCQASVRLALSSAETPEQVDPYADRLIVEGGGERAGDQILLLSRGDPVRLGTAPDNQITLLDPCVSRHHACLIPRSDGWWIRDEGSTNGILVNGQSVREVRLGTGDRVTVGEGVFHFLDQKALLEALQPDPLAAEAAGPKGGEASPQGADPGDEAKPAGQRCPGCDTELSASATICVHCGIELKSGRPLIIASELENEGEVYQKTLRIIYWLSFLVPIGIYPFASEAFGTRKPYAVWSIAVLTILTTCWFWVSSPEQMKSRKGLLLWAGGRQPSTEYLEFLYSQTDYGDAEALKQSAERIAARKKEESEALDRDAILLEAHESLPVRQRATGEFRFHQLVTHAFFHAGLLHLGGNLLFLLVLGGRVNALIGNIATAAIYPVVAIAAGLLHVAGTMGDPPQAMLGASGAVMGLAGMYLVFFPIHRIHMAAWIRVFFFILVHKLFALRGFWVVLSYIALDVVLIAASLDGRTAHAAHLGGFGAGLAAAAFLLGAQWINTYGGDLLSTLFGRYAWPFIGRPGERNKNAFLDRIP